MKILVVADAQPDRVRESALELVTLAASLPGAEVEGAVLAADPAAAARDLADRGGLKVHAVADPLLADYSADAWLAALTALVNDGGHDLVLASHGPIGWDWVPRLALRTDGAPASELTGLRVEGDDVVFSRKAFNAKLDLDFKLKGKPVIATVQRGSAAAGSAGGSAEVVEVSAGLSEDVLKGRFVEVKSSGGGKVDLTQAEVIVSGGRSLGGADKFEIIEALATALGGQVGASRPVTDAGWLPPEHQVGSSGVTVSPKLYIAAGISGAIQHVVGMKGADFIIAINKDARAPIFDVAHVGIVGDLFELVPALTAAVSEAKGQ
ncbi:MAG: electron transfer flavoprotein subunit alpha/FixB family protein [Acidobacteriota bacterium]